MIRWLLMRQCCHFVRTDLCSTQLHLSDKVKNHQYKGLKQNVVILGHQRPHPAETLKTGTMDSLDNSLSTRLLVAGHVGEAQGQTARYITSWNTHQLFHGKYQGSGLWGFFSPLLLYNDLYTIHTHTHTPLYEPTWNQTLVLTTHEPGLLPSKTPRSAPGGARPHRSKQ